MPASLLSPGMSCLRAGQNVLLGAWGTASTDKPVTFRGESLNVTINEKPTENWMDGSKGSGKGKVNFLPKDFVTISVLSDHLETDPLVGEYFVQSTAGVQHRIQEVQVFETHWICLCKTSEVVA